MKYFYDDENDSLFISFRDGEYDESEEIYEPEHRRAEVDHAACKPGVEGKPGCQTFDRDDKERDSEGQQNWETVRRKRRS